MTTTRDHRAGPTTRLRALREAATLLVALDYDGTLVGLRDDPSTAVLDASAVRFLRALGRRPDVVLALVSGRSWTDLCARLDASGVGGADGMIVAGSHGLEIDGHMTPPLTDAECRDLDRVRSRLRAIAADTAGAWIEDKPASVVLHLRTVRNRPLAAAAARAVHAIDVPPGGKLRDGRDVVEIAVRSATKGDALRSLRIASGADAVVFAGDDVTDDDGFAVLGPSDLGIVVGRRAAPLAHLRVTAPDSLFTCLSELLRSSGRGIDYP